MRKCKVLLAAMKWAREIRWKSKDCEVKRKIKATSANVVAAEMRLRWAVMLSKAEFRGGLEDVNSTSYKRSGGGDVA